MKKLLISLMTLLLFVPAVSSADEPEGVFVPNFQTFMSAFVPKVESIDLDFAAKIREQCYVDGKWVEPSTYHNDISYYDIAIDMRIREGSGFLDDIYILLPKSYIDKEEDMFKQLLLAAATSIIPDAGEEFEQSFFDNIYYDYAKESPAGYITMYWNCGVYCFNFNKSSSGLELTIDLSVYERE